MLKKISEDSLRNPLRIHCEYSMRQPHQVLNSISWRDLCPWLILFRSIGIALRPSIVIIAFAGLLVTPLGWSLAEWCLADSDRAGQPLPANPEEEFIPTRTQIAPETFWQVSFPDDDWLFGQGPLHVFSQFYRGHLQILNPRLNIRQYLYYFGGTVWTLLIWSILGTMICRIAAAQYTRDERIGIFEAFSFVKRRLVAVWASSFVPLLLIGLFAVPLFLVGLLMNVDFLLVLVGIGWLVMVLVGLMMAVVLIPLFFGYPLLWPAIATEGSDAFESVSRSYAYPTQKPYHYVFYWVIVLLIGFLAAFVASLLSTRTIEFARWGTSWGAGTERIVELDQAAIGAVGRDTFPAGQPTPSDQPVEPAGSSMFSLGARAIDFWEQGVRILAEGFNYGFFFVAMTGMYLLLRRDNDFSELDEIHVEREEDPLPLPMLPNGEPVLPDPLKDPAPAPTPAAAHSAEISPPPTSTPPENDSPTGTADEKAETVAPNHGLPVEKARREEAGEDDDGELRAEQE